MLKKETGKSAQEHILLKMIEISKEKIFDSTKTISEIAYEIASSIRNTLPECLKNKWECRQMNSEI
jgi:hypothetical protein